MTPPPIEDEKRPIERKVTVATVSAYLGSLAVMAVLNAVSSDPGIIAALPDGLEMFVLPLVPTIVAYVGGFFTTHTPRPDLPLDQR